MIGGAGNDTIDGGSGVDVLTGGAGSDQFRFSVLPNFGLKTITDFSTGADSLWFNHLVFTGLGTTSTGTTFATGDFASTAGHAPLATNTSHLIFDTVDHNLYYQASGSLNVAQVAVIGATHTVAVGDIHLY